VGFNVVGNLSVGAGLVVGLIVSRTLSSVITVVTVKSPYSDCSSSDSRTSFTPSKLKATATACVNCSSAVSSSDCPFVHDVSKVRTVVVIDAAVSRRVPMTLPSILINLTVALPPSKSATLLNFSDMATSKAETNSLKPSTSSFWG